MYSVVVVTAFGFKVSKVHVQPGELLYVFPAALLHVAFAYIMVLTDILIKTELKLRLGNGFIWLLLFTVFQETVGWGEKGKQERMKKP